MGWRAVVVALFLSFVASGCSSGAELFPHRYQREAALVSVSKGPGELAEYRFWRRDGAYAIHEARLASGETAYYVILEGVRGSPVYARFFWKTRWGATQQLMRTDWLARLRNAGDADLTLALYALIIAEETA